MKDFVSLLKRLIPGYKRSVVFNIINNILSTIFSVFSFAMIIPILKILFKMETGNYEYMPFSGASITDLVKIIKNDFLYFIVNTINTQGESMTLLILGLFLIIMTGFKTGFMYLAQRNMVTIRTGVVRDLRNSIFFKITSLPVKFFSGERKGDILARISGDVTEVENSVMSSLNMVFKNFIMIIVYLGTMVIISWKLTLFVLVLFPIAAGIMGFIGKQLKKPSKLGQDQLGVLLSQVEETISGLRILKTSNAEAKINERFSKQNEKVRRTIRKVARRQRLAHPMSEFLGTFIIAIVLWFGGALILGHKASIDAPGFIYYLIIFYSIINPAKSFYQAWYSVQKGLASMERIDKILKAENDIKDPEKPKQIKDLNNAIEYKNVYFGYNEKEVLHNINLTIPKGETVAIVGQSGSGKSTLVDLLPRLYDIEKGEITLDGTNIKEFAVHDLRKLMGNVNQEAILFNDTFFNNIAFGLNSATLEEVENAAKIANAHEFIMESPEGYNTNIGDRGGKLSGGQRQRISIARAILKNPPILILDEATSALDTESEQLVQSALENLMQNRTTIVIAHRLSTIRNADMICVMNEGKIIEKGTHEELIAKENGAYKHLYDMQNF